MPDLFDDLSAPPKPAQKEKPAAAAPQTAPPQSSNENSYGASSICVLEGLEPVRMRPGMYIGGTDAKALHHLFAEVLDNSMDEAVAGYATFIEVTLDAEGYITVTDEERLRRKKEKNVSRKTAVKKLRILHSWGDVTFATPTRAA